MKVIEVGTTPLDAMFAGGPVAYTPGASKKREPPAAPATKTRLIDERLAKVSEICGIVTNIYEAAATTPQRRRMAARLASTIAWLWDGNANAGRGSTHFRIISDEQLRRELTRLSRLGENCDVVGEVKRLHESTIVTLADFGFVAAHHAGQHDLVRIIAAAERALKADMTTKEKPSSEKCLPLTAAQINGLNRAFWKAKNSKPKHEHGTRGKFIKGAPRNERAVAARQMLAAHYKLLTGCRPTMTGRSVYYGTPAGGRFFKFTESVFAALNIKASVEAQTRKIAYPKRRKAK